MSMLRSRRKSASLVVSIAAIAGLIITIMGSGSARAGTGAGQTAYVAYAGSLSLVNDRYLGPAFKKGTGFDYQSRAGGSFGVANLIKAGEIQPNVFESVGLAPIAKNLEPRFTTWSVGFASQPLVVAYSPQSPFASRLNAIAAGQKPLASLFTLMTRKDFHLGRTNPQTDPQGQAFIIMLKLAAKKYGLPPGTVEKIIGSINNPEQIFAETALVSRLEAGQLDASSAFLPQAIQRHLKYIKLPDGINMGSPAMARVYSAQSVTVAMKGGGSKTFKGTPLVLYVTTITGTPDQKAGVSFVRYLLSPAGKKIYKQHGYYLLSKPVVAGDSNAVPQEIKAELR